MAHAASTSPAGAAFARAAAAAWRRPLAKPLLFLALLLLASLFGAAPAHAAISCSVSSTGLVFSAYDGVAKTAVDGVGTISVTCSGSGSTNLSLNLTGGSTGACSPRAMRNGSPSLGYQIYQDVSRSTVWCDSTGRLDFTMNLTGVPSRTMTFTMYGRVTGGQTASYGNYTDSLSISVKQGGGVIATGTTAISGSVAATCSLSAGTLGFGAYSTTAASLGTASVTVSCSSGAGYSVSLGSGNNLSGGVRRMTGPVGSYLSYQLYKDSARLVAWGDGTALGATASGTGSGGAQSMTVYGRIPAGQSPRVGSYSDSVVVTITY